MARDGFQDSERIEALKTLRGQLQQVRSNLASIKTTMGLVLAARQTIASGVASGAFDQADLDKTDSYLVPWTTVPAQPTCPRDMLTALLADNSWGN